MDRAELPIMNVPRPKRWMWYVLASVTVYYLMWLASEYGAARMGG